VPESLRERLATLLRSSFDPRPSEPLTLFRKRVVELFEVTAYFAKYLVQAFGITLRQHLINCFPAHRDLNITELIELIRRYAGPKIQELLPPISHKAHKQLSHAKYHLSIAEVLGLGRCANKLGFANSDLPQLRK